MNPMSSRAVVNFLATGVARLFSGHETNFRTPSRSGLLSRTALRALVLPLLAMAAPAVQAAVLPTSTALTISSTSVPYKTPITLTATVTTTGTPVTSGFVLFCDASAAVCENNSALGLVQLTSPAATATLKLGSGPLGVHNYKAIYRANNLYSASTSNTVSYTVQGTYSSTTSVVTSGSVGNYTLTGTVAGVGSLLTGPTGTLTFLDTSAGNNLLGTSALGSSTLTTTFQSAPGSPFAIANSGTTRRSVAIASAYLNADDNLDVVTGDAQQTITVLLGNGDGTFQPKVNYAGCPSGKALKILLADFNRDGNSDVALGCSDGANGSLTILLGNGDGTFQAATSYTAGDVAGIAVGDFNRDGLIDVAVSNKSQQNVMIFAGNGNGTFAAPTTVLSTAVALHDVVVADFNMDGKDDLLYAVNTAVSGSPLSDLYLASGNGDGTFGTPVLISSQVGEFLSSGDTNGDNFPDVISTTITGTPPNVGPSLFVIIGNGNGTFKNKVTYTSDIPSDPHLADVNGDGKPDIIAGGSYGELVYEGNGDGTFKPYSEPTIGNFALTYAVQAGDFNNDGNADLIGTDADTPRAAVSLSQVTQSATAAALTGIALYPLGSGTHNVDASYTGDTIYTGSLSPTVPVLAAPAPTTLTLAVSPTAATISGNPVTLTATLSPYAVGPPNTTTDGDSVNFYNGSTLIGSGTLSNGVASFTTSSLPAGSDALKAVYPGDPNYLTSTSSTINVTVTSIVITSSLNPSTYGQGVTFTGTVATGLTGSITFNDGSTAICTAALTGTTASCGTSSLTAALHNITGVYSGDGTHSAATSPVLVQEVDKINPTVTVGTSGPSTYGATVTITATVSSGTTGTVTITSGSTTLGSGTVSSGGTVIVTTSVLPVGSDPITASYGGDANYNAASASTTQTVSKASPTLPAPVANPSSPNAGAPVTITETVPTGVSGPVTFYNGTTVIGTAPIVAGTATLSLPSLPLGANPISASTPGDASNNPATSPTTTVTVSKVTPTVTVTTSGPSNSGTPVTITASVPTGVTGTITFTDGGTTLGSGTVGTGGTISITTSTLPVGTNTITASYGGDSNNNPATGTTTQVVSLINPTVTVTTSGPSTVGSPVTITASVPTGTTGTITVTSGSTTLGSGTVSPAGTVTVTTSALPPGTDTITANYSGDTNNAPATGSTTQTVSKLNPTLGLTSSANPSTPGQSVTFTATLPTTATGTVTFSNGSTVLGTGTIVSGVATVTTSSLPTGSNTITATYAGDTNNSGATGSLTQTVSKLPSTLTLTSSANPSTPGQSVTFTATLPTTTTGTVTFSNGSTVLGSGTIVNGVATVTTSALPAGSNTITATYAGDTTNSGATGTLTQTVNKVTPTLTLTSSANPSTPGQSVTFTATLPTTATGTVTFSNGSTVIGTGTIVSGVATVTSSTLPTGSNTITATYAGDTTNAGATGTLTQTVNKVTPTLTLTSSANPSSPGQSVTFTATLPTTATGTVTFSNVSTVIGTGTIVSGVATVTSSTLPTGSNAITATYAGDTNNSAATGTLTQTVGKNSPVLPPPSVTPSSPDTLAPVTISETVPTGVSGPVTFYDGGVAIGTAPIVGGVATLTVPPLSAGSHPITASTPGDTNNNPATSPATTITVTKATPVLPAPVVSNNSPVAGTTITITETVPAGVTGPVTFLNGGTVIGTAPIVGGVATIATSTLPLGPNQITASTPANAIYNAATSPATTVTVAKGPGTVTLTSSANPAGLNQPVTFTAVVNTGATGTVTFYDGATVLGVGTINAGVATFTTSGLGSGTHSITAVSSGDATYTAGTSAPLSQVINKMPTLTAITQSTNIQLLHTMVTFTAAVTAPNPTPTGVVTFFDGGTAIGTSPLSTNGTATVSFSTVGNAAYATNSLTTGSHQVTATYSGDTAFMPSTSLPVANVVADFTIAATGTTTQKLFPGDSTSYTFLVTPVGGSTFLYDTTVTIDGLPTGTDYTFTPATIAAGSGATTVTLKLTVPNTHHAANQAPAKPGSKPGPNGTLPVTLAVLGLVGMGAIRRHRKQMPRLLMLLLLCAASLLPVAAVTGCAGGYFALDPTTYSLNVTGTEATIKHAATTTLVVQ